MQVDDMLNIYSEIAGPKILVGDLNALPDAPELVPLFEYLSDSWDLAGEGEGYTFPVDNPHKRIDYILTSTKIEVVDLQLDEVTVEKIQMAVEGLIENEDITVTVEIVNSDKGTYKITLTKGEVTASKDITVTVIQETDKEAIQKG